MRAGPVAAILLLEGLPLGTALADPSDERTPQGETLHLGCFGGLFFASDRHELYAPSLSHRRFDIPASEVGIRVGIFPSRWIGVELESALVPLSIRNGSGGGTGYSVRAQVVAQYPERVSPFIAVGGGVLGIASESDELGNDSDGLFYWGLGGKVQLSKLFSLRLDLRQLLAPSLDEEPDESSVTSHWEALLGLSLTFPYGSEGRDD